jgi:hypothetical protein
MQIKTKIVSCLTADSKPVKQEVNGTRILPPLVFPDAAHCFLLNEVSIKALQGVLSHYHASKLPYCCQKIDNASDRLNLTCKRDLNEKRNTSFGQQPR